MAKKRAKKRATKATPKRQWKKRFIAEIAAGASFSEAAQAAGIHRAYAYKVIGNNSKFNARYKDALEQSVDALESAARRRAVDGVTSYEIRDGAIVFAKVDANGVPLSPFSKKPGKWAPVVKREYSDGLLVRLLAGRRPGVYGNKLALRAEESKPPTEAEALAVLDHVLEKLDADHPDASAAEPKE